jgi:hypothetical protein
MERLMQAQPHTVYDGVTEPAATDTWADSSVLYLLTCYDVWSATPSRGCEPVVAEPAAQTCPAA